MADMYPPGVDPTEVVDEDRIPGGVACVLDLISAMEHVEYVDLIRLPLSALKDPPKVLEHFGLANTEELSSERADEISVGGFFSILVQKSAFILVGAIIGVLAERKRVEDLAAKEDTEDNIDE